MIGDLPEVGMTTPSWCGRRRTWELPGWRKGFSGSCQMSGLKRDVSEACAVYITPSGEERTTVRMINGDCGLRENNRASLVCEWSQPDEGVGK
jgi:hypothetical protein